VQGECSGGLRLQSRKKKKKNVGKERNSHVEGQREKRKCGGWVWIRACSRSLQQLEERRSRWKKKMARKSQSKGLGGRVGIGEGHGNRGRKTLVCKQGKRTSSRTAPMKQKKKVNQIGDDRIPRPLEEGRWRKTEKRWGVSEEFENLIKRKVENRRGKLPSEKGRDKLFWNYGLGGMKADSSG